MPTRATRTSTLRSILVIAAVIACALPASASAATSPAAVTITACKSDALTLAGKVKLAGKDARKARGAVLQMRFQALALFGFPHAGQWRTVGKKTAGSGQEVFTGLAADNWLGVLSWRFKKGSRTVLSGNERSQPVKIGGSKGRANCTLAEGAKPPDNTPPSLFILPADDVWHRASAPVQITAQDDFSGVQSVRYSLDGGPQTPIQNGSVFNIDSEGAHTVDMFATDVAGNTGTKSAIVKVDAAAPTKPVVQSPPSVTAHTTPTIQWSASTDSGSGLRGYVVTIQRADGSVVTNMGVGADTTSIPSPALDDGQTYTVTVTAVDNTYGNPWATNSDPDTFKVDTSADVTGVTPAAGSILSGAGKDTSFQLTLDRPADPATVANAVKLQRNAESTSGSFPAPTIGCANTPCTTITVDPSGTLPEGRYTLSVSGLKSGDGEGTTFQSFSAAYSVAFLENAAGADPPSGVCINPTTAMAVATVTASAAEPGVLDFDWSYSGGTGWSAQAFNGGTPLGDAVSGSTGSNQHSQLHYTIPQGTTTITFKFSSNCSSSNAGTLDTNNLVGARAP